MTQEEVDLIYEYLHENYRYEDGELIKISSGKKIGSMNIKKGQSHYNCMLRFNKKYYNFSQQSLIYLFHKKLRYIYFEFKDNNKMNFKIENLIPRKTRRLTGKHEGAKYVFKKGYIFQSYFCINSKKYHIGSYLTEGLAHTVSQEALVLLHKLEPLEIISSLKLKYPSNIKQKIRSLPNGVHKNINTYFIRIMKKGKKIYLAGFKTAEEAHEAYLKAKKELNETNI